MLETLTALATCFNGIVLTGIWFKLGGHSEKHISHERRLDRLEEEYS